MTATPSVWKNDAVISSRIRLARNVEALQSPHIIATSAGSASDSGRFINNVYGILSQAGDFELLRMGGLSDNYKDSLIERHLISPLLKRNSLVSAAVLNKEENLSVMINEEDHLRIQCITPGLSLEKSYEEANVVDDLLISGLNIVYDERYGFITSSMADIGTGMRASVMLFLPALTTVGDIEEVSRNLYLGGFNVKGAYSDGQKVLGFMYQVSNRITIGKSEKEIIAEVNKAVDFLLAEEEKAREEMLRKATLSLKDHIMRSKGILTNACILPLGEFIERFGAVKLGVSLGYIGVSDLQEFNRLLEAGQSATLMITANKEMSEKDVEVYRAEYITRRLSKLIV